MTKVDRRLFELAACLAVMMHLWLFMGTKITRGNGLAGVPVAPETYYLGPPSVMGALKDNNIRTVWSPVLFAQPSELGFSRELMQERLPATLTFKQPDNTESYLEVDPFAPAGGTQISREELMLTAGKHSAPPPPGPPAAGKDRPLPRRVYVTPQLKERLMGGIVLPPELNQPAGKAWEVRADVAVSDQGFVRHVFLEQPLDDASMQLSVIRLLYGLRFRTEGEPLSGRIEIYSPESRPANGGEQ